MASLGFAMGVRGLSSSNFGDCGDDFSRQSPAADLVVPGGVVGDQPKERRQRHGFTARAGLEELQDGLDPAAQAAPGHGTARPGPTERAC